MSHFCVGVIVSGDTSPDEIETKVEELLSPYDETMEVEEYEEKCFCVGQKAKAEATRQAIEKYGTFTDIRTKFEENVFEPYLEKIAKERDMPFAEIKSLGVADDEINEYWTLKWQEAIAPYLAIEKEVMENHPDKDNPDLDCEDCNGTGTALTDYNPDSKWDWYQIGGRWTGAFSEDYDPQEDPRNKEICEQCHGSGDRPGWVYYEWDNDTGEKIRKFIDEHSKSCNGCNGCQGTRFSLKWPTNWVEFEGDRTTKVNEIIDKPEMFPYAIVTPDGEWHEHGNMGWWGIASNEKDDWNDIARNILEEYKDNIIVVVDCHI